MAADRPQVTQISCSWFVGAGLSLMFLFGITPIRLVLFSRGQMREGSSDLRKFVSTVCVSCIKCPNSAWDVMQRGMDTEFRAVSPVCEVEFTPPDSQRSESNHSQYTQSFQFHFHSENLFFWLLWCSVLCPPW